MVFKKILQLGLEIITQVNGAYLIILNLMKTVDDAVYGFQNK
jgi:hypothetical protein